MTRVLPLLVADIGGTNARFAVIGEGGVGDAALLRCADFPSLEAAAMGFLAVAGAAPPPRVGAFCVAGPVTGDRIALTNLPWSFSQDEVRRALGLERLVVINDFTAVALSVPRLGKDDWRAIGDPARHAVPAGRHVIGVIGPGTGLGVSGLVPRGEGGWTALAGEGGHTTMAAADDAEAAALAHLRRRFGHVSAERVVSGPGLVNLFHALGEIGGHPAEADATPASITQAAVGGGDALAVAALEMFCAFLGTAAGNLALTLGARGGVYIAGGIAPKIVPFLARSNFRRRFTGMGRMSEYLEPIPTRVITHPLPAFLGLEAAVSG